MVGSNTITFKFQASDGTFYSTNTGVSTLIITHDNQPPTLGDFQKTMLEGDTLTLSTNDFKVDYTDLENDYLAKIQISTLPNKCTLQLNGTNLKTNNEIATLDLNSLICVSKLGQGAGATSFTFKVSDRSLYSTSIGRATITINPIITPLLIIIGNTVRTGGIVTGGSTLFLMTTPLVLYLTFKPKRKIKLNP